MMLVPHCLKGSARPDKLKTAESGQISLSRCGSATYDWGMKRIALFFISFSVLVFGVSTPAQAAPKSIKLSKSQVKNVGPYQCGLVKGSWVPGRHIKTTKKAKFFIPYTSYAADSSKKAAQLTKKANKVKGKSKAANKKRAKLNGQAAKATRQANDYNARVSTQSSSCATGVYAMPINVPNCPTCIPINTDPLRITIAGAKGLAKVTGGISSLRNFATDSDLGGIGNNIRLANGESTLAAVSPTGELRNAITSGSIDIQNFVVASNGKAYISSWNAYIDGNHSSSPCILIEVSAASDVPVCIQYQNYGVGDSFSMSWYGNYLNTYNPSIQVDGAGAVYYSGYKGSSAVLRKSAGGVITDIISDNVSIQDFLVIPNGDVIVSGYTQSLGTSWLRLYAANGSVRPIENSASVAFMREFSDGNVYFGLNSEVKIFDTTTQAKRSTPYFAWSNALNNAPEVCPSGGCLGLPYPKRIAELSDDSVYSLSQSENRVFKLYPSVVEFSRGAVTDAKIIGSAGTRLAIAGLDTNSAQTLELYDPANSSYLTILGSSNEIEISSLSFRPSTNELVFSGLRFSDNKTVVGTVNLSNNDVKIGVATSSKLYDLQAFG
jgi:hypothetical protein